jgi:hypothetical protein
MRTDSGSFSQYLISNVKSVDLQERNAKQDAKLSPSAAEVLEILADGESILRSSNPVALRASVVRNLPPASLHIAPR